MSTSANDRSLLGRYSLRTLLIVVSLLAVLFAWIGVQIRQSREQRRLAAMCIQLGASITYTEGAGGKVAAIHFPNYNDLNDEQLKQLARLSRLRTLWLNLSKVTGSGLAVLVDFPALRELHLNGNQLTDDGIRHLKQLSSLDELRIWGVASDDPRVEELRLALPNVIVH